MSRSMKFASANLSSCLTTSRHLVLRTLNLSAPGGLFVGKTEHVLARLNLLADRRRVCLTYIGEFRLRVARFLEVVKQVFCCW